MAVRLRQALLVLKKSAKSTLLICLISVEIFVAVAIQIVFSRLETVHSLSVATVVGALLRNESTMSRSYLLAQSIEDMQAYGAIKCAQLSKLDKAGTATFYDSTYKRDCSMSDLTTIELPGLDGHRWQFRVVPNLGHSFYLIKWMAMGVAFILLLGLYRILIQMIESQQRRLEFTEAKRLFLEHLTDQARHDVASPISALNMIAERAPLDPETREFLRQAVSRTHAIFQDLKQTNAKPQLVSLHAEFKALLDEKYLVHPNFPKADLEIPEFRLYLDRAEFDRMVSNLLDNAYEAGASSIGIRAFRRDDTIQVVLLDDGRPLPGSVVEKLGVRGNTSGKAKGSGLGLYQGHRFMRSIGGSLAVSPNSGEKFVLTFPGILEEAM